MRMSTIDRYPGPALAAPAKTSVAPLLPVVPVVRVRCGLGVPPLVWMADLPDPSPTSS
jgi:hypothetical protein